MQASQGPQGEEATSQHEGSRASGTDVESAENNNKSTMKTLSKFDQDIIRLIGQHLHGLGFNQTTEQLMAETGCKMEETAATNLRAQVMNSRWEKAYSILDDLKDVISSPGDIVKMKFILLEQKYMELLQDGHAVEALDCLRYQMSPLQYNTSRLHELTKYLMASSSEDLLQMSHWDGKGDSSRQKVMKKLQVFFPPSVMLPPRRLQTLLDQAAEEQRQHCLLHASFHDKDPSTAYFLKDHRCSLDQFPSHTIQVLADHIDEVWYCAFSPDGKKLATGSKDCYLFVYDVNLETYEVQIKVKFDHHPVGVSFISWSPDSTHLVALGPDPCNEIWIYNIEAEELRKKATHVQHSSLTSAAWLPDSRQFIAGGLRGHFYLCDIDGRLLRTCDYVRVQHLHSWSDCELVLVSDSQYRINGFRFQDKQAFKVIQESHPIMSFSVNSTGRLALVNVANQGIHLWDLKDRVLVRRFQGVRHGTITTYSSFGGVNQEFFASGSEDPYVHIYGLQHNEPVLTLRGHSSSVSCVHWNPQLPSMLASASDDGTVRIWGPQSRIRPDEGSKHDPMETDN